MAWLLQNPPLNSSSCLTWIKEVLKFIVLSSSVWWWDWVQIQILWFYLLFKKETHFDYRQTYQKQTSEHDIKSNPRCFSTSTKTWLWLWWCYSHGSSIAPPRGLRQIGPGGANDPRGRGVGGPGGLGLGCRGNEKLGISWSAHGDFHSHGGTPIAGWFIRGNAIQIWMMTGGTPIFGIPHMGTSIHGDTTNGWGHDVADWEGFL